MPMPRDDLFWRYLPADPTALSWGLAVTGGGWSLIRPGMPYPPVQHPGGHHFDWNRGRILNEYQLIYLSRGHGRFESRSAGAHRISAGDLIILLPGEWHRYLPDPAMGWDEHWVACTGELPQRWRSAGLLDARHPILHVGQRPDLLADYRAIADLLARCPPGIAGLAAARVVQVLAAARSAQAAADDDPLAAAVRTACVRLAANPRRAPSITTLAGELGVPERSLRRAFSAQTGLPPKQWLVELRLGEAERLLSAGLSVIDVAGACGFPSVSFFSRRFRARTGAAPGAWQTHHRGTRST
ncbi:MAG: AraC family transcriptional regulator [Planctomycetes bacterium]|nr:AraC family transcriptional regulator [Planctomycetota bacterium]